MEKEQMKGFKKVIQKERTIFDDEEQRRYVSVHATLFESIMKLQRAWHPSSSVILSCLI